MTVGARRTHYRVVTASYGLPDDGPPVEDVPVVPGLSLVDVEVRLAELAVFRAQLLRAIQCYPEWMTETWLRLEGADDHAIDAERALKRARVLLRGNDEETSG